MANHPGRFGFEAGGEFAPAFEAAQRRLQASGARQRSTLARATSRVRTSGARFIPAETLERGQAEAQAGLIGRFAERQAEEGILDRRLREAFERRRQLLREGGLAAESLARRLSGGRLRGQIIAGGLGAIGTIFGGPVGGVAGAKIGEEIA